MKLRCDILLSTFAFEFTLRRYVEERLRPLFAEANTKANVAATAAAAEAKSKEKGASGVNDLQARFAAAVALGRVLGLRFRVQGAASDR